MSIDPYEIPMTDTHLPGDVPVPSEVARSRSADIRRRLRADMTINWVAWQGVDAPSEEIIDSFVGDAMFQVEILLNEIYGSRDA